MVAVSNSTGIYRGPSVVRLHRRYSAMMPTGEFCCENPDDNDVNQRVCIMIVHLEGMHCVYVKI